MNKPPLLLLNLPGRRTYLRDYYCSKTSKADYLLPPTDLVFQSGFLSEEYELSVLDSVASNKSPRQVFDHIEQTQPQIVLFLAGAVSWEEDREFLRQLHLRFPEIRLVGTGDVFLEAGKSLMEELPFLEAVLIDFSMPDLARYLAGERSEWPALLWREGETIHVPTKAVVREKSFTLPLPRHELFLPLPYRYSFCRRRRFAVVLTDFGCPFSCRFCVMPGLGYRQREVDNVMAEIRALHRMGIREFLFLDQTFGVGKERTHRLLDELSVLGIGWTAFTRVDLIDEDRLIRMKAAGCHTLILGVESGSELILKAHHKQLTKDQIREGFRLCRRHRIRTVATVIWGLPEETRETMEETFSFLREIRPDTCSFHVAVPRQGTPLREEAVKRGLIDSTSLSMDQSGSSIAMCPTGLTPMELNQHLRRAIRTFYFHPVFLLRQLGSVRSAYDLEQLVRQGWGVVRHFFSLRRSMEERRHSVALWFRYGAAEHTELFHALPDLIERLSKEVTVHYFGMRSPKAISERILRHAVIHEMPFMVNRTSTMDKAFKMLWWYACLPFIGLRCRWMGVKGVFIDDYVPWVGGFARIFFGVHVACVVGDFLHEDYARKWIFLRPLAWGITHGELVIWRRLPLIFVKVEAARRFLVKEGIPNERIHTVYDPCDEALFHPVLRTEAKRRWGYGPEQFVLVHHGILHPNKGLDVILRGLAPMLRARDKVRFLVVGSGSELSALRQMSRELGVEESVQFTGWLATPDEVNIALNAGDAGLVMRKGSWSDQFHLTGALVHSMAVGLPILAARLAGVAEIVREGEHGFLFDPTDMEEFRLKLGRLMDDEAGRCRMGERSLALAHDLFNQADIVERYARPLLAMLKS